MRLKEIREIANISQRTLAKKLNLTNVTVSKYERGLCDPSIETLKKMSEIFGVSIDALVGNEAELLDLKTLTKDQRKVVDTVVNKLSDNSVAKVVGYIENIEE